MLVLAVAIGALSASPDMPLALSIPIATMLLVMGLWDLLWPTVTTHVRTLIFLGLTVTVWLALRPPRPLGDWAGWYLIVYGSAAILPILLLVDIKEHRRKARDGWKPPPEEALAWFRSKVREAMVADLASRDDVVGIHVPPGNKVRILLLEDVAIFVEGCGRRYHEDAAVGEREDIELERGQPAAGKGLEGVKLKVRDWECRGETKPVYLERLVRWLDGCAKTSH